MTEEEMERLEKHINNNALLSVVSQIGCLPTLAFIIIVNVIFALIVELFF